MKLKYLFYAEVIIGSATALVALFAPALLANQLGMTDLSPVGLVLMQWYGVIFFAFTLIMALTLYKKSLEAVNIVFPAYALGDLLHVVVTYLLAKELGYWDFGSYFGVGFTLALFTGRVLVLLKNSRLGF
jgi:hypothetical protein